MDGRQTKVHVKYRTPYMPRVKLPEQEKKIMRKEIGAMKRSLINKQRLLADYLMADFKLWSELENIDLRKINSDKQLWNTWHRLYALEHSNTTSISGKRESLKRASETLNQEGYEGIKPGDIGRLFSLIDEVKNSEYSKIYGYDEIINAFVESNGNISSLEDLLDFYA